MVNDFKKLTNLYDVNINEEQKEKSKFLTLTDNKNPRLPSITVHFIDDRIYSIHFLNNEFFEIPDHLLMGVLKVILDGNYQIKTTWLKQRKSIIAKVRNELILPEKVHNNPDYDYDLLPAPFSVR